MLVNISTIASEAVVNIDGVNRTFAQRKQQWLGTGWAQLRRVWITNDGRPFAEFAFKFPPSVRIEK